MTSIFRLKMVIALVVLFTAAKLLHVCKASPSTCMILPRVPNVKHSTYLEGAAFRNIWNVSLHDCATECARRSACVSGNYFRLTRLCQLNTKIDPNNETWVTQTGAVFFNVDEEMKKIVRAKLCNNGGCLDGRRCGLDKNNNTACTVEECTIDPTTGDTLALVNGSVGYRKQVTCRRNVTSPETVHVSTCLENGRWSVVPDLTCSYGRTLSKPPSSSSPNPITQSEAVTSPPSSTTSHTLPLTTSTPQPPPPPPKVTSEQTQSPLSPTKPPLQTTSDQTQTPIPPTSPPLPSTPVQTQSPIPPTSPPLQTTSEQTQTPSPLTNPPLPTTSEQTQTLSPPTNEPLPTTSEQTQTPLPHTPPTSPPLQTTPEQTQSPLPPTKPPLQTTSDQTQSPIPPTSPPLPSTPVQTHSPIPPTSPPLQSTSEQTQTPSPPTNPPLPTTSEQTQTPSPPTNPPLPTTSEQTQPPLSPTKPPLQTTSDQTQSPIPPTSLPLPSTPVQTQSPMPPTSPPLQTTPEQTQSPLPPTYQPPPVTTETPTSLPVTCGADWAELGDNCYRIDTAITDNWNSAQTICSGLGADLVSFENDDQFHFVESLVKEAKRDSAFTTTDTFWIGGKVSTDQQWEWVPADGGLARSITYFQWTDGAAKNWDVGSCLSLKQEVLGVGTSSRWFYDATPCDGTERRNAICERKLNNAVIASSPLPTTPPTTRPKTSPRRSTEAATTRVATTAPLTGTCEQLWEWYGDLCYRVLQQDLLLNWNSASDACLNENADLVALHDADQYNFVVGLLDLAGGGGLISTTSISDSPETAWTSGKEGQWHMTYSNDVININFFRWLDPNDSRNNETMLSSGSCLVLTRDDTTGEWFYENTLCNGTDTTEGRMAVCQKSPTPDGTISQYGSDDIGD